MQEKRQHIRWAFQPSLDDIEILSPEEQLDEFLNLTMEDLAMLQARWGPEYLQDYIRDQLSKLREYGTKR